MLFSPAFIVTVLFTLARLIAAVFEPLVAVMLTVPPISLSTTCAPSNSISFPAASSPVDGAIATPVKPNVLFNPAFIVTLPVTLVVFNVAALKPAAALAVMLTAPLIELSTICVGDTRMSPVAFVPVTAAILAPETFNVFSVAAVIPKVEPTTPLTIVARFHPVVAVMVTVVPILLCTTCEAARRVSFPAASVPTVGFIATPATFSVLFTLAPIPTLPVTFAVSIVAEFEPLVAVIETLPVMSLSTILAAARRISVPAILVPVIGLIATPVSPRVLFNPALIVTFPLTLAVSNVAVLKPAAPLAVIVTGPAITLSTTSDADTRMSPLASPPVTALISAPFTLKVFSVTAVIVNVPPKMASAIVARFLPVVAVIATAPATVLWSTCAAANRISLPNASCPVTGLILKPEKFSVLFTWAFIVKVVSRVTIAKSATLEPATAVIATEPWTMLSAISIGDTRISSPAAFCPTSGLTIPPSTANVLLTAAFIVTLPFTVVTSNSALFEPRSVTIRTVPAMTL